MAVKLPADGELRICVPMSDVIDGQFDKDGVTMLLGTGGGDAHKILQFKLTDDY
jgi:hypothetical protein